MEDGQVPANLHYNSPNLDIPGLSDGRLKVCTERTPVNTGLMAINSFGFGGSNVHALLRSNTTEASADHPASNSARLVTYSARTEAALKQTLEHVKSHANNVELQTLLQESANSSPDNHPYRGYAVLNNDMNTLEVDVRNPQTFMNFQFIFFSF